MSIRNAAVSTATLNDCATLDPAFAGHGKTQVYFAGSTYSMANGIAVDASGGLWVAAKVGTPGGSRFGLARLLADGSADLAFGDRGSVVGEFEPGFEATAGKVVILGDGHILLVGLQYENPHSSLPALALFDRHGQPVQAFGANGRCVVRLPGNLSQGVRAAWLPPGVPGAEVSNACVQADGRILLLANHQFALGDHVGVLIRLNADGCVDATFNGRGFVLVRHLLMNAWLSSLLVLGDGRIVVGGSMNFPEEGLLARYHSDGRLDERFAVDGFMSFLAQGRHALVNQIVQQPDGDLWCFGSSRDPMQCMALKVHGNGRPDRHCNDGQAQLLNIGRNGCQWTAAQALADGSVLSVGATVGGVEADFILARYRPGGQLDDTFGDNGGWVRTRLGRSLDTATSVAVQDDGNIVVGGYSLEGNYRAIVARYRG